MATIKPDVTLKDYQGFIEEVYGGQNVWHFSRRDLLTNAQRFLMRSLKGVRKNDPEAVIQHLIVSTGFFLSLMTRLRIDVADVTWRRFPYLCSYCASVPCVCKEKKVAGRLAVPIDESKKPSTVREFQTMFEAIYPARSRTLAHAAIHLAEELGEVSESFLSFKGTHTQRDYQSFVLESADMFSCYFGVCNSLGMDLADRLAAYYPNGCHKCINTPCTCTYETTLSLD
jgi:NTP pyrophosphatase (non-canonical NTP hydrolase)